MSTGRLSGLLPALGAIALWASLATLGLSLRHLPPLLLTGLALLIGSVPAWVLVARRPALWRVPPDALLVGAGTLFGFHFLLFMALRLAPPVAVNLVNYLWPLLIVVLAPLYLDGLRLRPAHAAAAGLGFAGAALAIAGGGLDAGSGSQPVLGYLLALGSALTWANYSLLTRRAAARGRAPATAAVGLYGLVAGLLSLLCHALLEPAAVPGARDWALLILTGLGPLGAAFYLWDHALQHGDARRIGILSYLTPLASTLLLTGATGQAFSLHLILATGLILGAAVWGTRAQAD